MHKTLLPAGWPRPKGYANGISAEGRMVFTAGVIGWNAQEKFDSLNFSGQFEQAVKNVVAILAEADAKPEHLVRMTCYVVNKADYVDNLESIGSVWRDVMGKVFPCMAVVEVSALIENEALVEIEATAVVPSLKS